MPLADGALLAGHVRAYPHGLCLMQHVLLHVLYSIGGRRRRIAPAAVRTHQTDCRLYTRADLKYHLLTIPTPVKEKAAEMCLCPECTLKQT